MPNTITESLLTDVRRIDAWCSDHPPARVPQSAIEYVSENKDLLMYLVDQMAAVPESQLRALQRNNRALDQGVTPAFFAVPRHSIQAAFDRVHGNKLINITADDMHMIRRALEYAPFTTDDTGDFDVAFSPVQLPR